MTDFTSGLRATGATATASDSAASPVALLPTCRSSLMPNTEAAAAQSRQVQLESRLHTRGAVPIPADGGHAVGARGSGSGESISNGDRPSVLPERRCGSKSTRLPPVGVDEVASFSFSWIEARGWDPGENAKLGMFTMIKSLPSCSAFWRALSKAVDVGVRGSCLPGQIDHVEERRQTKNFKCEE